jgi:hypothetical protein
METSIHKYSLDLNQRKCPCSPLEISSDQYLNLVCGFPVIKLEKAAEFIRSIALVSPRGDKLSL